MRPLIASLLSLPLAVALAGCDRQKATEPQGEPTAVNAAAASRPYPTGRLDRSHAGTPAPTVTFEDPQGRPVTLAAFRGKPLLLNLWATWCAPCVVEMPALDALAGREGERLRVLTLSQDANGRQKVTDFFREHSFERLEAFLDPQMQLMMDLRLDTLPTTILYDAQGREVWRMTGMAEWGDERTTRLLAEAEAS